MKKGKGWEKTKTPCHASVVGIVKSKCETKKERQYSPVALKERERGGGVGGREGGRERRKR
jgi:hypothetical protein